MRGCTSHAGMLLLLATLVVPRPAAGQDLAAGLVGGALGLAGGGFVSVGIVTLEARRGDYLYSARDALGWHSVPILVGAGTGLVLGLSDRDRLRRSVIGGLAAGAVGTALGVVVGDRIWPPPEGRWAGAVVGGAAGLIVGVAAGALVPSDRGDGEEASPAASVSVRIPVG